MTSEQTGRFLLCVITAALPMRGEAGGWRLDEPLPAGGAAYETVGRLTAATGSVDIAFTLPVEWPAETDQTLFHVGEHANTHVTIFFRKGALIAVYKADKEHYAAINDVTPRKWVPGSRHEVQYFWRAEGTRVPFYLRVDGRVAGTNEGWPIASWPTRFYLGNRGGRSPWLGTIEHAGLAPETPDWPELRPGRRSLVVDATNTVGTIYDFWSTSNYTREDMFTDPRLRRQQLVQHPRMKYVNCVRLLGGREDERNRWYLGLDAAGKPRFDFAGLVACLRGMLAWGYTPRIVLDNVPTAMSDPPELNEYGNTYPPKDYAVWEAYVEGAVRAMVDAFGRDTVAAWRLRVGTEPDLFPGHWAGTKEQYLHHYARTVAAVCRVIPKPDIGPGNILSPEHGKWGLELVDAIATNALPMTFFSCSWYGRVGRSYDGFETVVNAMRSRVEGYQRLRGIPIEIAEFAVLNDEYNRRLWAGDATEWGGSWFAGITEMVYRLGVARVHQWATTTAGLPHPTDHVTAMLERMLGGRRLAVRVTDASPPRTDRNTGAICAERDGRIYALLYNHRPLRKPATPETITLTTRDARMRAGEPWRLSEWRVDREHGVFIHTLYDDCLRAGLTPKPDTSLYDGKISDRWGTEGSRLLRANHDHYEALAKLPEVRADVPIVVRDGELTLTLELPGHSVSLLVLTPPERAGE